MEHYAEHTSYTVHTATPLVHNVLRHSLTICDIAAGNLQVKKSELGQIQVTQHRLSHRNSVTESHSYDMNHIVGDWLLPLQIRILTSFLVGNDWSADECTARHLRLTLMLDT